MSTLTTDNWDTAFGITFRDANAAIVAKKSSPASFSGQHTTLGSAVHVAADFGAWRMTGGSDALVHMTLPLRNGTVSGSGQEASFEGAAEIQVGLTFIPQPGATSHLVTDAGRGVSVLDVTLTSGPDSARDAVRGALQDWLGGHLDEFTHVFAAVDLSDTADTGDFAWLQPTYLGYAIDTDGASTPDDYLFGVLTMTEHRRGVRLSPEIDPGVIPAGADAGFLISPERVVEKMFRPHAGLLFKNPPPDPFDTRDDGMTLYNTVPLDLPDFTLSDGTKISDAAVGAGGFTLSVGTSAVVIAYTGLTFTYTTGYTATVTYRSVNTMATDGKGHLQLTPAGDPALAVAVTESSGEKWKDIWEEVGIAVAGAVVGAVLGAGVEAGLAARATSAAIDTGVAEAGGSGEVWIEMRTISSSVSEEDQLADEVAALRSAVESLRNPGGPMTFAGFFQANGFKLLGAAVGALVGGGIGGVIEILQGYADDDPGRMPTLGAFADTATGATTWSNSSGYTLTSAVLHSALQLGLKRKGG